MDEGAIAEMQRWERLQSVRHNYRFLRTIFKAAPRREWEEMKRAYRFGIFYPIYQAASVFAAHQAAQSAQPDKIGV